MFMVRNVTILSTNGTVWTVKRCTLPNKYFISTVAALLRDPVRLCVAAPPAATRVRG